MSKLLKTFLREWLTWAEGDALDDKPFKRRRGLCASFEYWLDARDIHYRDINDELELLNQAFKDDRLEECYPFGGVELFYDESDADEMHLNESRLAWVRSKVEQFAAA